MVSAAVVHFPAQHGQALLLQIAGVLQLHDGQVHFPAFCLTAMVLVLKRGPAFEAPETLTPRADAALWTLGATVMAFRFVELRENMAAEWSAAQVWRCLRCQAEERPLNPQRRWSGDGAPEPHPHSAAADSPW